MIFDITCVAGGDGIGCCGRLSCLLNFSEFSQPYFWTRIEKLQNKRTANKKLKNIVFWILQNTICVRQNLEKWLAAFWENQL